MSQPPATASTTERRIVVLVTGPSGAGRSTALRSLEDLGYESIDNLPMRLIRPVLQETGSGGKLVLGVDVRNRNFDLEALIGLIDELAKDESIELQVLYLDCRADVLIRRFSETRRRHPLAPSGAAAEGVARELKVMAPLRDRAEILIDTSDLTPHDLRAALGRWFHSDDHSDLAISIQSFSYKRGLPQGADIVMDARFLRNPHWVPELRPLDGRDPRVAQFIERDPRHNPFFVQILALAEFLLPEYFKEGKSHLTLAFGCTGGQHRSVALAEGMATALAAKKWAVSVRHHELERRETPAQSMKAGDAA